MMYKTGVLLVLFLSCFYGNGQNLRIDVSRNSGFDNSNYVVTEAGEDFQSAIESETSTYVSVTYHGSWLSYVFYPNKQWRVFVHKSDMNWDNNLSLEVRRTGTGNLLYSWFAAPLLIQNGDNYQDITNNPTYFFRGRHGITDIPVQFRISGASLTMGAQQFETSVVFTIYDDW